MASSSGKTFSDGKIFSEIRGSAPALSRRLRHARAIHDCLVFLSAEARAIRCDDLAAQIDKSIAASADCLEKIDKKMGKRR